VFGGERMTHHAATLITKHGVRATSTSPDQPRRTENRAAAAQNPLYGLIEHSSDP
jgi:hypothetical protein